MGNFLQVKTVTPNHQYEFYCPHCKKAILFWDSDRNQNDPLPSICPECKHTIDPTGVAVYKED